MKLKFYLFFITFILLCGCEQDQNQDNPLTDKLIAHWVNPVFEDSLVTFTKASFLIPDEYGFTFEDDHFFLERRNIGWCGTPPVVYGDFDGYWSILDSTISITLNHNEGLIYYDWKVISVDESSLTLHKKSTILM